MFWWKRHRADTMYYSKDTHTKKNMRLTGCYNWWVVRDGHFGL